MITATDLELRAGARILLHAATFRVAARRPDRPGRPQRRRQDHAARAGRRGRARRRHGRPPRRVGYLPQDPRTGDLDVLARDRVLSARGLDELLRRDGEDRRSSWPSADDDDPRTAAPLRPAGGPIHCRSAATRRRPRRPASARTSACPTGSWASRCARCPAASAAGSSWPGSCSRGAQTLLLDEPTNHLDADSIVWLRDFLQALRRRPRSSSATMSSLLDAVVNKVFHLDANRAELDLYNVGWKTYLEQRETDERRRKRERANAEKKAAALMRPGRQDAGQGDQGRRRAEHGPPGRAAAGRRWRRARAATRWPARGSRPRRRAAARR